MSCSPEWAQPPLASGEKAPHLSTCEGHCFHPSAFKPSLLSLGCRGGGCGLLRGPTDGVVHQGLTPRHLSSPPVSGFRSYPLRGSHSLDNLLDRPGNSTASSEYWDGQSRSRTPSRVPSHTPSPAPTPLPGSRRGSMGSMGVPSDVKVSPLPQACPQLWGRPVGREARDQVTLSALPLCLAVDPRTPASVCPALQGRVGEALISGTGPLGVLLGALEKASPPCLLRGGQTRVLGQSLAGAAWEGRGDTSHGVTSGGGAEPWRWYAGPEAS